MSYRLTMKQAVAEIIAAKARTELLCGECLATKPVMPMIYVDKDAIFVHIGQNELIRLASTRCPANARMFKTLDAAFRTCMAICASAGLEGFQRIEVTGYVDDYDSADVNT